MVAILERKAFLREFMSLFGRYFQSNGQDEALYVELTQRLSRMQRQIGGHGILYMFRPPFANFAYRDFPILLNLLPEYRTSANDWALRSQASHYASAIRDCLLRYSGSLEELEADSRSELKNPFIWFREGVRTFLALPFRLLRSLGILSGETESEIRSSKLARIGAGVLALVTLAAGIVQIVTGWDGFLRVLSIR
jgi:hypothetical protein